MAFLKPQNPLQDKRTGDYFYPLTTVDQVVMEDGSRLNSVLKHTVKINATLLASGWTDEAPYTQTITLNNINTDLNVDINIVYSGVKETDIVLNGEAGCLTYIKKEQDNITFYCLKKKPEVDIPIEIEGTCTNSIVTIEDGMKLNFDVIRYETEDELLATTPAENTIGIITDIEFFDWIFAVTQPSNPSDNMIWITTGISSEAVFNALKKNNIQVYPVSAKQYVSGTWVDVTAKSYQGGAWVDWYNRDTRIAELNATGWARYSEGVTGEYVRYAQRGFTRNSILPAIWCWSYVTGDNIGFCILGATKSALATTSVTQYGNINTTTLITPSGNTLHIGYMPNYMAASLGYDIIITSNGKDNTLSNGLWSLNYYDATNGVLSDELLSWADELLFGVR